MTKTNVIPVPASLEPGAETAQWVLDQITTFPETHVQQNWQTETACGTTYCVAGWAATVHPEIKARHYCGNNCGVPGCDCWPENIDWLAAGMEALCLDEGDANQLFWGSNLYGDRKSVV